jgi:CheY-like chemotaxis protein
MNGDNETNIKILIVEDVEVVAATLKLTIEKEKLLAGAQIEIESDHDRAFSLIVGPHPYDIIVLDLFRGNPVDGDLAGQKLWEQVLSGKFVPLIIHTAFDGDLLPNFPRDNPILRHVQKGTGSDKSIANHLKTIKPYILLLREVQKELNLAMKSTLLDTSSLIWRAEVDEKRRGQLLLRSTRRRLAAMMDLDTMASGEQMLFWEQYIWPPLGGDLLTGDLIRVKGSDTNDPTSYRLIITPSCDLVMRTNKTTGEQRAKAGAVLVANCRSQDEFLRAAKITVSTGPALTTKEKKEAREKLRLSLTQAQSDGYVFLPGHKPLFPAMAAYLRDLDLIPMKDIVTDDEASKKFERVVSIDSPFREQIAWAYLQIAGRPGMPDRDANRCIDENFEHLILPTTR